MKKLPPDPDGQNNERAGWAYKALSEFQLVTGTDACDALADLLNNLMHLCDRNSTNFETELIRARGMYVDETRGEPMPTHPIVVLDYRQFRAAYMAALEKGGNSWTEADIDSSWRSYRNNPAGHFLSKP